MRRARVGLLIGSVVAAVALGQPGPAWADPEPTVPEPEVSGPVDGAALLEQAEAAVAGEPVEDGLGGPDPEAVAEPSLALTELYAAYDSLTRRQQAAARQLLARPNNDDDRDPVSYPEGATVERRCGTHVCVHYIEGHDHAPPDTDDNGNQTPDWVEATLAELESVWTRQVDELGFRAPASDARTRPENGGDGRLDVYLANVSALGYYGYCAPERQVPGQRYRASGYCVLDDDFVGFATPPEGALRATAAHELFHAVQFNYDFAEDTWLMEGTATWMEERLADDVDDNRSYLRFGQLGRPTVALDRGDGFSPYGNWVFFERLSRSFGVDAVRAVWSRLDSAGADAYSVQGLAGYLRSRGTSLGRFYLAFAAGNVVPAQAYEEGGAYPSAPVARSIRLTDAARSRSGRLTLQHLSHAHVVLRPDPGLRASRLRLRVDGPAAATDPRAKVRVHLANGRTRARTVRLDRDGRGGLAAAFRPGTVTRVTLTLANASGRYACWQGTTLACQGRARDNGGVFRFTATAVR